MDKIRFELNQIYDNDGIFNLKTHVKLASAITSRFEGLDEGLKNLNFVRDEDDFLQKLCPGCGRRIVKRYESKSEFCPSCQAKDIKIS